MVFKTNLIIFHWCIGLPSVCNSCKTSVDNWSAHGSCPVERTRNTVDTRPFVDDGWLLAAGKEKCFHRKNWNAFKIFS